MSNNNSNKKTKTLAIKMGISLGLGVIVGLILMFLREALLNSSYSYDDVKTGNKILLFFKNIFIPLNLYFIFIVYINSFYKNINHILS